MTAEAPSTKNLLSRKKKIVFTVVTVIIVFLFCALLIDLIVVKGVPSGTPFFN